MVAAQGQSGLNIDDPLPGDDPDVEDKRKLSDIRIDLWLNDFKLIARTGAVYMAVVNKLLQLYNHLNHNMKVYHSRTR